jgi:hypothetical protein
MIQTGLKTPYNMKKGIGILQTTLIAMLLTGSIASCDKVDDKVDDTVDDTVDEKVDDPAVAIIGKWELIAEGYDEEHMNHYNQSYGDYIEFLPDGRYMSFLISQGLRERFYKIDSNYLYVSTDPVNPRGDDRIWKYEFLNRNKLKWTYVAGPIAFKWPPTLIYIYKRKK